MVFQLKVVSPPDDFSIAWHSKLAELRQSHLIRRLPAPRAIADEPVLITTPINLRHIITFLADNFLVSDEFAEALTVNVGSNEIECIPMNLVVNGSEYTARQYCFLNVLQHARLTDWDRTATDRNGVSPKFNKISNLPANNRPGHYFFQSEPSDFSIWIEDVDERSDRIYVPSSTAKYMTKRLWGELDKAFPNTLVPVDYDDPARLDAFYLI